MFPPKRIPIPSACVGEAPPCETARRPKRPPAATSTVRPAGRASAAVVGSDWSKFGGRKETQVACIH